jgi:hypothetical protein
MGKQIRKTRRRPILSIVNIFCYETCKAEEGRGGGQDSESGGKRGESEGRSAHVAFSRAESDRTYTDGREDAVESSDENTDSRSLRKRRESQRRKGNGLKASPRRTLVKPAAPKMVLE